MASSSSTSVERYDVFISFRGTDTRWGFTTHLHEALCEKGIKVFIDEDDLKKGDEISPVLLEAIKASAISIVVFSENYAQSRWCLDELNHIVRCMKQNKQLVLPVFYKVEPSNIRHQKRSFEDAFSKLETRFGHDSEKLKMWRESLRATADLSGWNSADKSSERDLITDIVDFVTKKLRERVSSSDYTQGLIGYESNMQKIESAMCIGSTKKDNTRIVGIWGMGGIGKTTLARALFKRLSSQFSGSSFLENVSEEVKKHQPSDLQKKVFSELLNEKELVRVTDFDKRRLSDANVLIVLDNVDHMNQLEFLAKDRSWFGPGSRVVVTTRNLQVLRNIGADDICEVEELSFDDALRLFLSKAFRKEGDESPDEGYSELAKTMVEKYAKGNPLALTVLGLSLCSKSIGEWESKMELLESTPHHEVQKILRVSYDGLSQNNKDMFLDIACFFKSRHIDEIKRILGYRYKGVAMEISVLFERALVTVDKFGRIWMHDLIQEMGREIVTQQSNDDPGERNRLWSISDIFQVFEEDRGTKEIQGIFLMDASVVDIADPLTINPMVFKEMRNLWFLDIRIYYEFLLEDLDFLPDTLRYLNWWSCPLKSLPQSFNPKNLCEVNLNGSELERLWNPKYKDLQKLEILKLNGCSSLSQLPDLSRASNLVHLELNGCSSLSQLPDLSRASNLVQLKINGCSSLSQLPDLSRASNLMQLELRGCSKLFLDNCDRLKTFPTTICKLKSLQILIMADCLNLEHFPEILEVMECLEKLWLDGTGINKLHPSIENLTGLQTLNLRNCRNLEKLPETIFKMQSLVSVNITD